MAKSNVRPEDSRKSVQTSSQPWLFADDNGNRIQLAASDPTGIRESPCAEAIFTNMDPRFIGKIRAKGEES